MYDQPGDAAAIVHLCIHEVGHKERQDSVIGGSAVEDYLEFFSIDGNPIVVVRRYMRHAGFHFL